MRSTSGRRRSRVAVIYRGTPGDVRVTNGRDVTVPDDDPEGVVCKQCGARVRALSTGRPRAHAAGGYAPNTRAGRFKCEGSGSDGSA